MPAVTYDYNGASKTITNVTAERFIWGASEISGDATAAYYISLTGTNNDYGSIGTGQLVVKAGGQLIMSIDADHLTAYIQRMSTSKWAMAATDTAFTLPLYTLDAKGDERYSSGFPAGQSPSVEVPVDGTGSAGTITIGWRQYDGEFPFYQLLLGSALGFSASVNAQRFPLTQGGLLRGFSINTTGLDALRLVINGTQIYNMSGPQLVQSQAMEGQDGGSTDEMFMKIDEMLPITAGNSFIQCDTGAGWAGVANQITLLSLVPQETTNEA